MSANYEDEQFEMEEKEKRDQFFDNPTTRTSGAIGLIAIGVIFLLTQNDILDLSGNWWAIFIAIPAVFMLYNAFTAYNREQRVTPEVRKNVSGGAMVAVVAVIAATGEWGTLWPLFLIVPGVLMLLGFSGNDK